MKRPTLAFVAALVTWVLVASLLNRGLRFALDGYAAAEPQMTFTRGMMVARLALGAIASLSAGAVIGWIVPRSALTSWAFAVILLAVFIPEHMKLRHLFPVWYHLTFLLTLIPLVILGSQLAKTGIRAEAPRHARNGTKTS